MWNKRREDDLRRELDAHLAEEADELEHNGLSTQQAQDAARKSFGNRLHALEDTRRSWGFATIETVQQDFLYALRTMRRSPMLTALGIATLALGIGANTAIFSVVSAVLLRPLGYHEPDRLVHISHARFSPMAPANLVDLQRDMQSFESMAAASAWSGGLETKEGREKVLGLTVSTDTFRMLGVAPALGRAFFPEEHQPGKNNTVILSHRLWQRAFGANPAAIGSTTTLSGAAYTIVGVMPPSFQFAPFWFTEAELWLPMTLSDQASNRRAQYMRLFARLKPGVTLDQAATELSTRWHALEQAYPLENGKLGIRLRTLNEMVVGNIRPALLVLLAAVGFVLLIACANLANLALARSVERRRELAIRTALGAPRARIIRQLMSESLVVSLCGGALGALLAWFGTDALQASLRATSIPRVHEITIDAQVLLFVAAISILTGLLFGLFPALDATRPALAVNLRDGGRASSEGHRSLRTRAILVMTEVALSIVLLAGAGLMLRTFAALRAIEPGFDPHNTVTMQISVAGQADMQGARRAQFYHSLADQVRTLPGIESAAFVNHIPIGGDNWRLRAYGEGLPVPADSDPTTALYRIVTPGYFRVMRIPLREGRDFTPTDRENTTPVVIVNETLARRLWPTESAIGKRLATSIEGTPTWYTIVGVSAATRQESLAEPPAPEYFFPYDQTPALLNRTDPGFAYLTLVVRTALPAQQAANAIRALVAQANKEAVLSEVRSMEQFLSTSTWQSWFYMFALLSFAGFALLLAAVGIYGVMAWSVTRRRQEIGIRIALGADRARVIWMVLRQSAIIVASGVAIGLPLAFAATHTMSRMLYGVTPSDPATFLAVPAVLIAVALLASYFPARRASGLDPVTALRAE
ncbi:MAG: ABC transporter permease [Acidobacteria bacterium]|nr:ABC transporter permease [Acidobacteriota bacterium]